MKKFLTIIFSIVFIQSQAFAQIAPLGFLAYPTVSLTNTHIYNTVDKISQEE